jgi:hypothetical protein
MDDRLLWIVLGDRFTVCLRGPSVAVTLSLRSSVEVDVEAILNDVSLE